MPITTQYGQTFYPEEAYRAYPEGCTEGNNSGGECPFCQIYYGWDLLEREPKPGMFRSWWDLGFVFFVLAFVVGMGWLWWKL